MKHILYFRLSLSLLLGIIFITFFSNYGNKVVHPDLNAMMLGAFIKQNSNPNLSDPAFKNYTFYFLSGTTLKGTAVIKDGLFKADDISAAVYADIGNGSFEEGLDIKAIKYIAEKGLDYLLYSKEGPAEKTVKSWIVDGGYSADVPEVPASLRHFYDPTRTLGDRYLTDIANGKIMGSLQKYVLTNPQIDGVQWALGKPGEFATGSQDHHFTWESGKLWMQMALKETNKKKKSEYMANAWRSLGETLHMIADNGCPPHVRNDAHPSPFYNNNTWFGNPDPYEEMMDELRLNKPDEFARFGKGVPDKDLKNRFATMSTAAEIAHEMAVFTNLNFVTNETISGIDRHGTVIRQINHPETPYNSPLLQNMTYNEKDYTYSTSNGVKQCADRDYFGKSVPQICEPKVTMECVISQAKVLIPNIIEAGKNVIKLYIPKLKIEILSAENNVVKGVVRHTIDAEYPSEIKYSGAVKITLKDKNLKIKKEIEVPAKDGLFECNALSFGNAGNKVVASIEFGGIAIRSENFDCALVKITPVSKGLYSASINRIVIYVEGSFDKELDCGGYVNESRVWIDLETHGLPISSGLGSFKGSRRWGNYFEEISGTLTEESVVEIRYRGIKDFGCREQQWDVIVKDIPRINPETENFAIYMLRPYEMNLERNEVDMSQHVPLMSLVETNMDNRQFTRNLIETSWNRLVVGSTIMESPKIQKSSVVIIVNR